jgi:hypothetical protein
VETDIIEKVMTPLEQGSQPPRRRKGSRIMRVEVKVKSIAQGDKTSRERG